MSNLDDLNYKSILDMGNDEAIETLRQIRLSRRTQKSSPKKSTTTKKETNAKTISNIDASAAAELLKLLGG
jgi:hypothetical protein